MLKSLFLNRVGDAAAILKLSLIMLSLEPTFRIRAPTVALDNSVFPCTHPWPLGWGLKVKTFLCPQRNFGRHIVIALSVGPSVPLRLWCISHIFFEVGIPNLVCRCNLGWQSVAYHFWVTVTLTLTSDLVFIVITMSVRPSRFVSSAYLLYSLR